MIRIDQLSTMDGHSLGTASQYLNNLLLARGLLKSGKPLPFADPAASKRGLVDAQGRTINLIHDLVLRRDRDAEKNENLASNVRSLKLDNDQKILELQSEKNRNDELLRNAQAHETRIRTLKGAFKSAEAKTRDLREQTLKMKSTIDQNKAKSISEIRAKDMEINKLKSHLAELQAGQRGSNSRMNKKANSSMQSSKNAVTNFDVSLSSPDWAIEKESNEMLTALVNETSSENVALRGIVSGTMDMLKSLTGLDEQQDTVNESATEESKDGIGIPGQYRKSRQPKPAPVEESLKSCDILSTEMHSILQHCKTILKDPSFVSIDEVQIREEEIVKLRQGWEKMAARWKEAVTLMDTWRRRMTEGGEPIALSELSNLDFGRSIAVLPNGESILGDQDESSTKLFDHEPSGTALSAGALTEDEEDEDSLVDDRDEAQDHGAKTGTVGIDQSFDSIDSELDSIIASSTKPIASPARRGIKLNRPISNVSGNSRVLNGSIKKPTADDTAYSTDSGIGSLHSSLGDESTSGRMNDTFAPAAATVSALSFSQGNKPDKMQKKRKLSPPMGITQKLAAIEAEALEAERARKQNMENSSAVKKMKTTSRKASRRRSTLKPEELQRLMGMRS